MVPAGSDRVSRAPPYSGLRLAAAPIARTGLSPPLARLSMRFRFSCCRLMAALQPRPCRNRTGLGCSPFARRYSGNRCCFLLLRVLRCFSSPGLPPDRSGYRAISAVGCPIRTPTDQGPCAPPRSFSQLVASFFASESQGIPRAPLVTSRALSRPVLAHVISSLVLLRTIFLPYPPRGRYYLLFLLFITPPPRQRTSRPSLRTSRQDRGSDPPCPVFPVNLPLVPLWRITDSNR
jgi:hypothetical protein